MYSYKWSWLTVVELFIIVIYVLFKKLFLWIIDQNEKNMDNKERDVLFAQNMIYSLTK